MDMPIYAIARGREGHWEAICFDFDIAVQGRTFNEVEQLMYTAVETYVEDAMKEDDATRDQLLSRRAPWHIRASWVAGFVFAAMCGRAGRRGHHDGRGAGTSSATVPFAVPCHA